MRGALLCACACASAAGLHLGAFPAGSIVAVRTPSKLKTGYAEPVFLDVLSSAGELLSTVALPNTSSAGVMALTSRRSTVEGQLSRSDDGCFLAFVGYDATFNTPSPYTDPSVPRSVAVISADGDVDISTSSMGLAALTGTARGAALVGDGSYVLSSDAGLMAPAPLHVARADGGPLVADNVRGVAAWRGSLFVTTASYSRGALPGVWRLNAAGAPIVAPADGSLGEFVGAAGYVSGSDQGPYGVAVADDFTVLVTEETDGLFVFRANATQAGGGAGWHRAPAPPLTDPGAAGAYAGFTHVGVDPLTGVALVVSSYDATKDSDDDVRYTTTIYEVLRGVEGWDGALSLRAIATSPAGFDYRGAQPAPSCAPLPSSTPFPAPAPATATASRPPSQPSMTPPAAPAAAAAATVNVAAAVTLPLVAIAAAGAAFFYYRSGRRPTALLAVSGGSGDTALSQKRLGLLGARAGGYGAA